MFKVIKKEGSARRGEFVTVHGTVQTPAKGFGDPYHTI